MKAHLIRIGNSRGVRLPKLVIDEVGLGDEVDIAVEEGAVIIRPIAHPRAGWAQAAKRAHERGEDRLLDEPTPTRFDEEEWRWK